MEDLVLCPGSSAAILQASFRSTKIITPRRGWAEEPVYTQLSFLQYISVWEAFVSPEQLEFIAWLLSPQEPAWAPLGSFFWV